MFRRSKSCALQEHTPGPTRNFRIITILDFRSVLELIAISVHEFGHLIFELNDFEADILETCELSETPV